MSFAFVYVLILVIWFITWFTGLGSGPWGPYGNNFIIWLLFVLIGWQVYGPLIHP